MKLHRTGVSTSSPRAPRSLRRRRNVAVTPAPLVRAPDSLGLDDAPVARQPAPVPAPRPLPARVGGARLLAADMRTGFMLLNEGRYRTLERVFGLPRAQANVATLIATVAVAEAAHDRYRKLMATAAPGPGDLALGAATARQMVLGSASKATPDLPVFAALAAFAIGGRVVIPTAVKSVRGVATAASEVRSLFMRRYWRPARAAAA